MLMNAKEATTRGHLDWFFAGHDTGPRHVPEETIERSKIITMHFRTRI